MHRSIAVEVGEVAPGSVLLSTVVGITLATGGFAHRCWRHWHRRGLDIVLGSPEPGLRVRGVHAALGIRHVGSAPQHRHRTPMDAAAALAHAHQFLSTAAVGFASFHGLVLMGDR